MVKWCECWAEGVVSVCQMVKSCECWAEGSIHPGLQNRSDFLAIRCIVIEWRSYFTRDKCLLSITWHRAYLLLSRDEVLMHNWIFLVVLGTVHACYWAGMIVAGPSLETVCFASFVLVLCHVRSLSCRVPDFWVLSKLVSLWSYGWFPVAECSCKLANPCFECLLMLLCLGLSLCVFPVPCSCFLLLLSVHLSSAPILWLANSYAASLLFAFRSACSLEENVVSLTPWGL